MKKEENNMKKRKYNSFQQLFSKKTFGDTISSNINLEDTEMLSRVHFYNTIYLYGAFENSVAQDIVGRNAAKLPLYLYETPKTAYVMAKDRLQNPVILRFAVNIAMSENVLAYDSLIAETKDIINKTHLKKDEYMKKCNYIREIKTVHRNFQVIQYKIKNTQIIENVQHI